MKREIQYYTQLSALGTILVLLAFTPIGSITLPFVKATTTHIPVIIGAILLDMEAGIVLGTLFGIVSVIRSTIFPTLTTFVFSPFIPVPGTDVGSLKALIVAFVPRILIGIITALLYQRLEKTKMSKAVNMSICALTGTLVNTIGVLSLIYLLFGTQYASALGIGYVGLIGILMTIVATNGISEAIAAAIITPLICNAVNKSGLNWKNKKRRTNK